MDIDVITYILIALIVIISIKIYIDSDTFQLKCIISDVDGNKYCVRERAKLELVADQLAHTTNNMKSIVEHCRQEYGDQDNVKRLLEKFNPQKIYEILPTSEYTLPINAVTSLFGAPIVIWLLVRKQKNSL